MKQDIDDMDNLERELEMRFEKTCERNGWSATAYLEIGGTRATLMLDQYSQSPITQADVKAAHATVREFIASEFEIRDFVESKVFEDYAETVPNTIAPNHVTVTAKIDVSAWLKRAA